MLMQAAGWRLPAGRLPGRCRRTLAATAASGAAATGSPEVVVVGGGAAGLTAAYWAADAGARVTVLERMSEAGEATTRPAGTPATRTSDGPHKGAAPPQPCRQEDPDERRHALQRAAAARRPHGGLFHRVQPVGAARVLLLLDAGGVPHLV